MLPVVKMPVTELRTLLFNRLSAIYETLRMAAMDDPTRVPSTDFSKKVGRDQDLARDRAGSISAEEKGTLHREEGRTGIDAATLHAAAAFLARIRQSHVSAQAILFGSRARGTHTSDSDADIAVILDGTPKDRFGALEPMSDAAYDILMETGIYIQPLALWEVELNRPELFGNPALIENIKRDGVWL